MGHFKNLAVALVPAFAGSMGTSLAASVDIEDYIADMQAKIQKVETPVVVGASPQTYSGAIHTVVVLRHARSQDGNVTMDVAYGVARTERTKGNHGPTHPNESKFEQPIEMYPDYSQDRTRASEKVYGVTMLGLEEVRLDQVTMSEEAYNLLVKRSSGIGRQGEFTYVANKYQNVGGLISLYEAGKTEAFFKVAVAEMQDSLNWAESIAPDLVQRGRLNITAPVPSR